MDVEEFVEKALDPGLEKGTTRFTLPEDWTGADRDALSRLCKRRGLDAEIDSDPRHEGVKWTLIVYKGARNPAR